MDPRPSALLIIARKLDHRTNPPSEDEDPLRLIDAPDVKEGYFRQKQEAFAKEFAAKGYKHNPHGRSPDPIPVGQCMMTFVVRPEFAGGLIGKRGSAITAMRDASGAKITVHDNGRLSGDPNALRTVEINGTEAQCWHARKLIEKGVVDQGGAPCAEARVQKEGEIPDLPAYLLEYKPAGRRATASARGGATAAAGTTGTTATGEDARRIATAAIATAAAAIAAAAAAAAAAATTRTAEIDATTARGEDITTIGGAAGTIGEAAAGTIGEGGGGWDDRGGWNRERGYQEQERGGWGGGWDGGGAYGQQQQWGRAAAAVGAGARVGSSRSSSGGGQGQQQGYGGGVLPGPVRRPRRPRRVRAKRLRGVRRESTAGVP